MLAQGRIASACCMQCFVSSARKDFMHPLLKGYPEGAQKGPFSWVDPDPHLIQGSLDLPESTTQMAFAQAWHNISK